MEFIDLPKRSGQAFEMALACSDAKSIARLQSHGWKICDALPMSKDIFPYRSFIAGSRGEFTVSKDQYVRLRTGWFSDRSACYLAAGRPVITHDTGFGKNIPTGAGLFGFNTMEEIVGALEAINSDYDKHCQAARAIAEEYFRAETVTAKLLEDCGI
jgi:glycosyltransferase involved in cell wall biosynthesis